MSRLMRVYYYAVLGAIGGLIGWQASNLTGLSFTENLLLNEVIVGALIGLCIGVSDPGTKSLSNQRRTRNCRGSYWSADRRRDVPDAGR